VSHEELLEQIESAANFVRGIQFDQRLLNDAREALRERAMELDDFVDNYSNENASKWCIKTSRQGRSKVQNLLPSDTPTSRIKNFPFRKYVKGVHMALTAKKKAFAQARTDGSFRFVSPSNFPKKLFNSDSRSRCG
jgi:hypothetical protein